MLVAGVTLYDAVAGPPDHEYVLAPVAVSVVEEPEHTLVTPEIVIVGGILTVTVVEEDVEPRPCALYTVTEYCPLELTVIDCVV